MKKIICLMLCAAMLFMLTGCAAREFLATLGFDTHDYEGEEIIKSYGADSDIAEKLSQMVKYLTINSVDVPEFEGAKEAIDASRDAVLNYMLNSNYSRYTGNIELLDKAGDAYPQMQFSVIIPAEDFQNTVYKVFGGKERVANSSGKMFEYLDKVDAYITAAQPQKNNETVNVISVDETENTYRLKFTCTLDSEQSDEYFALIVKRQDDSCYFRYIKKA